MSPETLKALRGSIKKWERIATGEGKAMSPGAIIKSYGIDHDRVVRAINYRYRAMWSGGLCFTFENIGMHGAYETVPRMLTDLNDRIDLLPNYNNEADMGFGFEYYCPDIGNNQRLMLLAFMLTWLGDKDEQD